MKEESRVEMNKEISNSANNLPICNEIKFENEKIDNSLRSEKKEEELSCSFPLSLEIPDVNVNTKNGALNSNSMNNEISENNKNVNNSFNQNQYQYHPFLDVNSGLSPFINNNIHNFSFNSLNLKGKNLFVSGGNK
jgi:hypothetical protein